MITMMKRRQGRGGAGGIDAGPDVAPATVRLAWIDEFIDNIRPYVRVRERDSILIKMPNQAFRLNATGARVMRFLLEGGEVGALLREAGEDKAPEIAGFLSAVKRALEGVLRETDRCPAVEVRPLEVSFSSLPILAEIALTGRCNLRCVFCYAGCGCRVEDRHGRREMSREEVKQVIDRVRNEAEVPSLSFTGGEPTLRSDLADLVGYAAREKGMRVNLITNGTLISRGLAESLQHASLSSAQVSIEGASAAVHDAVTGVRGSFEQSLSGIANLRAAGIHVHANTTINRLNFDECVGMPRLAAELGIDRFSMNLIIPSGSASVNSEQLVRYEEAGPLLERVISVSAECGVEFMWYSPTPICLFNPVLHGLGNKGCSACDGLLSVDSNGDVLPCSSWREPVGNILESGFDAIWEGAGARAYRSKSQAHPGCSDCDSFPVCHGACPLYWRHFGYSELERRGLPADYSRGHATARGVGAALEPEGVNA